MKKICLLVVCLICSLALFSCFSMSELSSLEFDNSPAASYEKGAKVKAEDYSVKVVKTDGTSSSFNLNDSNLTVQGLNGDYIDTTTSGVHTLKVSYQGLTITFSYIVEGEVETGNWNEKVSATDGTDYSVVDTTYTAKTANGLAWFSKNVDTYKTYTLKLDADVDMGEYEWTPIQKFEGNFDGQGHTISNLNITNASHDYILYDNSKSAAGLFGYIKGTNQKFENVTLLNTSINVIQDKTGTLAARTADNGAGTVEQFKNYGSLIGCVATSTSCIISNVNVINCYIKSVGRSGGLVGQINGRAALKIKNCYVSGSLYAYNPTSSVVNSEGDGDKIGGIIGQTQGGTLTVEDCIVKVIIDGTRDLGGVIGYNAVTLVIKNTSIDSGTVISASVGGGMEIAKGPRHVGGMVGTLAANDNNTITITNCIVDESVIIVTNNLYNTSLSGKYIGGLRPEAYDEDGGTLTKSSVNGKSLTVNVHEYGKITASNILAYLNWEKGILNNINK